MKTHHKVFGVTFLTATLGAIWIADASQREAVALQPLPTVELTTSGTTLPAADFFGEFPGVPENLVTMNGFLPVHEGEDSWTLLTIPRDRWFVATDVEVVALDPLGREVESYSIGLYEFDPTGQVADQPIMRRWANCSVWHSSRGLPFRPTCDVMLKKISVAVQPVMDTQVVRLYYHINGFYWQTDEPQG